jgi:toxin ParE1/3/4
MKPRMISLETLTLYAAAMVRKEKAAARSLNHFSERGRIISEMNDPSARQLMVGNYRLIYRVTPNTVYVLGLIHCARDLSSLVKSKRLS